MSEEEEEVFLAARRDYYGGIDPHTPSSARMWNYWLGGKDNFPVDQEAGDRYFDAFPAIADVARLSRAFLARTVNHLVGEKGVRQFIDLGVGLPCPSGDNVHAVAQRVDPTARIVYVDHDPLVMSHAHGLLNSAREGVTEYITCDVHDPERILRAAAGALDFTQPIAVLACHILCHVVDDDQAHDVVSRLAAGLPGGGFLVFIDGVTTIPTDLALAHADHNLNAPAEPWVLRDPTRTKRLLDGLELLPPGLVAVSAWRPEVEALSPPPPVEPLVAICRIPSPRPAVQGAVRTMGTGDVTDLGPTSRERYAPTSQPPNASNPDAAPATYVERADHTHGLPLVHAPRPDHPARS